MGYAFISYSSVNQAAADAMKRALNKNGIDSWMAPGDIPVGSKYAEVITKAIKNCACVVLLLTNDALNSVWVPKELERAVHYRKPIISLKLEDIILNEEFEFYISTDQIIAIQKIDENAPDFCKALLEIKSMTNCADHSDLSGSGSPKAASAQNFDDEEYKKLLYQVRSALDTMSAALRSGLVSNIGRAASELHPCMEQMDRMSRRFKDYLPKIAQKCADIVNQYQDFVDKFNIYLQKMEKGEDDSLRKALSDAEEAYYELLRLAGMK